MQEDDIEKFTRLCQEAVSQVVDFVDFDGWNCHDLGEDWNDGKECRGWDGQDRRCDCGNRRVSWELDGDIVRAVAW